MNKEPSLEGKGFLGISEAQRKKERELVAKEVRRGGARKEGWQVCVKDAMREGRYLDPRPSPRLGACLLQFFLGVGHLPPPPPPPPLEDFVLPLSISTKYIYTAILSLIFLSRGEGG